MRRLLMPLVVVIAVVVSATPAAACSPVPPPLYISPSAGPAGTAIRTSGYCDGTGTLTLDFTYRSDPKAGPVDRVSITSRDGAFETTLTNKYAPPRPPGAPYRHEMQVTFECNGGVVTRVPFFATEHTTRDVTRIYAVTTDGAPAVRGFSPTGAAGEFSNFYAFGEGRGGSIAVMKPFDQNSGERLVVGSGPGGRALFHWQGFTREAYPHFRGGVSVATGDVDGDGQQDIVTAAGPGGGPHVKVWKEMAHNPRSPVSSCGPNLQEVHGFNAYDPAFAGGVSVAVADLDLDGRAEIITGALAGGGPHVRVFDEFGGVKKEFMAYDPAFRGGVNVAAGDVLADSRGDIVTGAGPGGGPHVRVFTHTARELSGFYAYAPDFAGGVFVAAGHPTPDGVGSIVTGPGAGGGPHVRVLDGYGKEAGGFFAYGPVPAGVRVAVAP